MAGMSDSKPFTGKHMLIVMVAFFGVIITVNLVMATFATKSWTGLVVKNSYVASQEFNEIAAAAREQDRLGWQGQFVAKDGRVTYLLTDQNDGRIEATEITLAFKRPAFEADDHEVKLAVNADGLFQADHALGDGIWVVQVSALADQFDGLWKESFRIEIEDGLVIP